MKPFNLAEALAGAPVCMRDGRPVTQLTKFNCNDHQCLYGVVDGQLSSFYLDGLYTRTQAESHRDLVMAPVKHTIYLNIYREPDHRAYGYRSQEEAERFAGGNALAIAIPVEVEY